MGEGTLGGYQDIHARPPAFQGLDGRPYSVDVWVDDEPGDDGTYGASLLFVRWEEDGGRPDGHLETGYLVRRKTAAEARTALRKMTLHELKDHLDRLIEGHREPPTW